MSSPPLGPSLAAAVRPRPRFLGLLYVDRRHDRHVNLRTTGDPVAVYVGCASLLAASARAAGESFTVVTNAAAELKSVAEACGYPDFPCAEIPFDLELPADARFFQAHHKLCVLDAMGSGVFGPVCALVDIDAVMLRPVSAWLEPTGGLCAYVLDERLAGASVGDLDRLIGRGRGPRHWYGGELIVGDQASLAQLSATCRRLLPRYIEALPQLVHVGDETIVSAALNRLREEGMPIADAGGGRLVARWYSSRLPVRQEPLARALEAAIVHLPSDKLFLQRQARRRFAAEGFRRDLERHALAKTLVRALANPFLCLAEGERKFAPRLWGARAIAACAPASAHQAWP